MKTKFFFFSLLAFLFVSATAANAQTLEFENKSNCVVVVQISASATSCIPDCQTGLIFLQPESSTQIALPPCGTGPFATPAQFFQIEYSAGGSTGVIGLGCGLSQSDTYIDCEGVSRTIVMNSVFSATIY